MLIREYSQKRRFSAVSEPFPAIFRVWRSPLKPPIKPQKTAIPALSLAAPLRTSCAQIAHENKGAKQMDDQVPDLLYGYAAIGDHLGLTARQAESQATKGEIPTFKMGRTVCARRSTIAKHFAAQEQAARL